MIQLGNRGTVVREVVVNGGEGKFAYYIGFTSNGLPEVGLEEELRVGSPRLAGYHFNHADRDWVIVYGVPAAPAAEELAALDTFLYVDQLKDFFCPECGIRYQMHSKEIFYREADGQKTYELWCRVCQEQNDGTAADKFRLRRLRKP
jgi:hypothetical protein